MSIFEWAVIGAVILALFFFCARIMRRGLSTLDDDRKQNMERIASERRKIDEDKKNISASDHMYVAEAGLRDLLRLEGKEGAYKIDRSNHVIKLASDNEAWQIEFMMRERRLRSRNVMLHGRGKWLLHGENANEEYYDLAPLMASLARYLRGEKREALVPQHIARRIAARGPAFRR